MTKDEQYMQRCLDLAEKGSGWVAPNPMVGAVLVCEDRIIGEGWHAYYGQPHAEVNAIQNAMAAGNGSLLGRSTLYVSLEPCAHHGKTPPCDQLIIQHRIPRVVVGCRDPFPEVNGKGIEHLLASGVNVEVGVLEKKCIDLNRRFFCFHLKKRPYIILKWAQTESGIIGSGTSDRLHISGAAANQWVHQWRSEEAAIMVGSQTALLDNPRLTNRSGRGAQPVRILLDRYLHVPKELHVFDGTVKTIVLNHIKSEEGIISYIQINPDDSVPKAVCDALSSLHIQSVLIEGGARLLSLFMQSGCWDEARVITSKTKRLEEGVRAPEMIDAIPEKTFTLGADVITYYYHQEK